MPTVTMKLISPKRLDIPLMLSMLADGVQQEGEIEQGKYEQTTRTWTNAPDHEMAMTQTKEEIKATNLTDDEIYYYAHNGTKAHPIVPKRKPMLIFKNGYRAKTTPGVLRSKQGGAFGKTVVAHAVQHPGTKARGWTDILLRNRPRAFKSAMQRLMNDIAKVENARGQA